jgi:hypothetical protein
MFPLGILYAGAWTLAVYLFTLCLILWFTKGVIPYELLQSLHVVKMCLGLPQFCSFARNNTYSVVLDVAFLRCYRVLVSSRLVEHAVIIGMFLLSSFLHLCCY